MEPTDQSGGMLDETGDETFGDDGLDDTAVDDTEDYSMMEGGVGESDGGEPQAGTSGADGTGEGQGIIYFGKALKYPKIIFKDYEYHLHVKEVHKTRWHCQKHKRNKCKAFIYTTGNTVLVGLLKHNHPPDVIDYEKLVPKQVAVRLKV